jgi:formylglycine-generating enzyme required for sulfatase activity
MQYRITDRAAIEFAQQFYEALGDGEPVDGAVAEARKAINMAVNNTVEWGTPVLYMRSPDGVLFHITERPTAKRAEIRAPELPSEDEEEREKRLCKLYTDGVSARWREDWDEACRCFEAIVRERPDHQDAATKLEEARRQSKLAGLYTQAQAAREEGDWSGALVALEKLVGEQVNYKDAADLLKRVKTQKELADLYAQARHLHRAEEWTLVVKVFAEIVALAPDYADPESLLVTAKQKVAEQQRQAELDNLHDRAVLAMEDGRWVEAGELLYQTEQLEPGYRDNDRLLTRVEVEIQREETARQCQTLYEQAQALANAGDWSQALVRMQEIQKLDSQFADPEGIAARARKEVEGLRRWEGLYSQAQAAQEAGDWAAAVGVLEALVAEAPDFSDAANLLGKARERKELAELQACAADRVKTTQRPSTPSLPRGKREAPAPSKVRSFGGVEMVYVPSGAFWMGSGDCDKRAHDSEKPQHEVFVRGFWIGRTPVTNEQYQHFVEATDHGKPGHWKGGRIPEGTETHPVVYVSWHDAQAYCRWQSERAEVEIRLPSEAEWEKAARWSDGRLYPWGDEFDKKNCNSREGGPGGTTPVGRYSPDGDSPYGLADMAGNVWEWTANEFGPYPYDGDDGREDPQAEVRRVLRGGSWDSNQRGARAAYRLHNEPSYTSSSRGFRCARSGSEP